MKMTQPNYNIPVPQFSVGGQKMPKWANGLIVVGSLAIVGAVGYYFFVKWREKKKEAESQIILDQVKTELQQELANGQKLSHPKSTYSQNATLIGNLLNGCETINSEMDVANAVMQIVNNKADWLELVSAFGKKDIADCGTWGVAKTNYALPVLLKEQLDTALMFRNASWGTLGFIGGSLDFNYNGVRKTFSGNDETIDVLRYYLKQKGVTI